MRRWALVCGLFLAGCGGSEEDEVTPIPDGPDAADRIDAGLLDAAPSVEDALPPAPDMTPPELRECETPSGVLPDDVVVLEHHDGTAFADVTQQEWSVVGTAVSAAPLHESVYFELTRPARILGYAVQYGQLPEHPAAALTVSLHPDFGYNGFDFWAPDPLARAQRCRADANPQEWVEFILPEPVAMPDPGLVHVAHLRGPGDPAFAFDQTPPNDECTDDCCASFGACHSAWNFPELRTFVTGNQQNYAYNGLTLTFRYDYMVRLYVEYTDDVAPEETLFTPVPDLTTSNRMAWGDYDNDGDEDLLVNGPRLLRNDGDGFTDVTEDAGLAAEGIAGSGIFGDYDNDGCLDLFLFVESYSQSDHLMRSDCEGGFVDVTEASRIVDVIEYMSCDNGGDRAPTPGATWVDIDSDGFLDLYVANFICWASGQSYLDTVWRSRGNGTFENWTGKRGFPDLDDDDVQLASRGAQAADFDADGDVDILVNTYRLNRNLYYRNDGGRFVEQGAETGLAGQPTDWSGYRYHGHSIGTAVGDLDGDVDLDVVIANLAHPRFFDFSDKTQIFLNQGDGTFADNQGDWSFPAGDAGLRFQETHSIPTLGDFDNNGDLDLVISAIYEGRPTDFYWGQGDGTFRLDAWRSGIFVTNGWGQAAADFDQDGHLDLATSVALFRNQRPADGHWLQTRVVGNVSANRAGIGATVFVDVGDRTFVRVVGGGTGQGCQDSLSPHYGLGAADSVDRVRVRFPGSDAEVVYDGPFAADQRLWLYEDGTTATGWAADW